MQEVSESAWLEVEHAAGSLREQIAEMPRMPIEVIACPLGKDVNHGGILRLAEAFRIQRVTFSHEEDGAEDFSGNRGATKWQPYRWLDVHEALDELDGYQKVALTLSDDAVDYEKFDYQFPLAFVVGSEMFGIPKDVAERCDACVAIPMYGLMGSLNVATATAIVLQHIARQYAEAHDFEPIREESKRLLIGDPHRHNEG